MYLIILNIKSYRFSRFRTLGTHSQTFLKMLADIRNFIVLGVLILKKVLLTTANFFFHFYRFEYNIIIIQMKYLINRIAVKYY